VRPLAGVLRLLRGELGHAPFVHGRHDSPSPFLATDADLSTRPDAMVLQRGEPLPDLAEQIADTSRRPFGLVRDQARWAARLEARVRDRGMTASLDWTWLGRLTRKAAEVWGGTRSTGLGPEAVEDIPFRPRPTLRAAVIRERPAIGAVRASPIEAPTGGAHEARSRNAGVTAGLSSRPPSSNAVSVFHARPAPEG